MLEIINFCEKISEKLYNLKISNFELINTLIPEYIIPGYNKNCIDKIVKKFIEIKKYKFLNINEPYMVMLLLSNITTINDEKVEFSKYTETLLKGNKICTRTCKRISNNNNTSVCTENCDFTKNSVKKTNDITEAISYDFFKNYNGPFFKEIDQFLIAVIILYSITENIKDLEDLGENDKKIIDIINSEYQINIL